MEAPFFFLGGVMCIIDLVLQDCVTWGVVW